MEAKPLHPEQSLETVVSAEGVGEAGTHAHCTQCPAAQCTRGRRGRRPGPTHASTIWEPLPGLGGPAEEAGLCPGAQSGSILISRGNA